MTETPTAIVTPTPTPDTPTPVVTPTATPTPPTGGHPVSPDAATTVETTLGAGQTLLIEAPVGAVDDATTLHVASITDAAAPLPANFKLGGIVFSVTASQKGELQSGFTFETPVRFTITYRDEDIAGLEELFLSLLYFDDASQSWQDGGVTVVARNPNENDLVVEVTHLTIFGLFEAPDRIWLPVVDGAPAKQ